MSVIQIKFAHYKGVIYVNVTYFRRQVLYVRGLWQLHGRLRHGRLVLRRQSTVLQGQTSGARDDRMH